MFLFGGWDYESILAMVDDLVFVRKYGNFLDLINNLTVKELMEIFTVIQNKERAKEVDGVVAGSSNSTDIPTQELPQDVLDFLMK